MKCPTHSTRFLAHLLLAAVAISSTVLNEEEVTESYEYDFSTPDLDAYTPIQGVRRQSLDLGGLDLGLEEDAAEICTVDGLRTPYGAIAANCTKSCLNISGDTTWKLLKNETPCIAMREEEFNAQDTYKNFSCRLGLCDKGICMGSENCTWCWKTGVTTMDAPN
uniref:Evasin n=1 Tax=Rhipicephalus appendiculatus TaxID=34631 RepID=A0A131YF49_RHIAP